MTGSGLWRRFDPMKPYRAIAEYYDAECDCIEMLHSDVGFFLDRLPKRRQDVLELAVGTGRAAIPIAQAGHRVVGVDVAQDMLAIARRKRDSAGPVAAQLDLLRADVRRLKLKRRFDWICIFFNTFLGFATLEDQDAVLDVVRRHLKPTGKLWLDIFQPSLDLLSHPRTQHLEPILFQVPELGRTVYRDVEVRPDPARQVQRVIHHYRWFDASGRERRAATRFDLTFLFPRELRLLLERNGLRLEELWGDYDGSALNSDSPRIIACASLQ